MSKPSQSCNIKGQLNLVVSGKYRIEMYKRVSDECILAAGLHGGKCSPINIKERQGLADGIFVTRVLTGIMWMA